MTDRFAYNATDNNNIVYFRDLSKTSDPTWVVYKINNQDYIKI